MARRFANSEDFLEVLNLALGEPTPRGLNTLVSIAPEPISAKKLQQGLRAASDEEIAFQRAKQQDPNAKRQLHGWIYSDDAPPVPRNPAEWQRAYDLAASLKTGPGGLSKLLGGYGGERGAAPTGKDAVEMAADYLYNASYGFDTLTGAPLNYKADAGHLNAFALHGNGQVRPEQQRVNRATQDSEGMEKLLRLDESIDAVGTADLYRRYPAEMEQLLSELPSSNRETKGWQPELNKMRADQQKYHWNKPVVITETGPGDLYVNVKRS